ncbi:S1 family peptidase [Marinitenerispora sediminis]|uniref:Serine protease n=1 Tax=Marinitenerispora sediminis TaxID=1931232 RepID=A0A368T8G6_9ACTN|nr:S1 family peptidase [Marinitenerispora sediminis]RCV53601.1 serine protease [Marinitenerispora sediminis]RCV55962.1 serine protease [Marinitenerispora sediminis]RCV60670.1 serine protease [Marinitenerispora sediminis]
MRNSPLTRTLGGTAVAFGLVVAAAPLAAADPAPQDLVAAPAQLDALQRDLGLDSAAAARLLTQEAQARSVENDLRSELGDAFGGSVFDAATGALTVSVTDESAAHAVRAAGATPRVVTYGESVLDGVVADLNSSTPGGGTGVTGWYVDTAGDSVVITVREGETADAERLVEQAGVDSGAVRVEESSEQPRTYADIVGGDPYSINGTGRCSIGFAVEGGFATAGHCGDEGTPVESEDGSGTGSVSGSVFPGSDMGYVEAASGWTPTATVNDYDGGTVTVAGSEEAAEGASICRSGSTTGWHCGTVESKNQTVVYPEGQVTGLTRTDVCAEPGDSGGSWLSGDQAQGVTSGGSGNCTSGGTTYFQPLNPILEEWNLTLVTG